MALVGPPAAGFDGLPRASTRELRLARVVTVMVTVWLSLVAAWELFGPILAGHYAAAAGNGIMAENMWRWGIAGPVWEYTATKPPPAAYYVHHPWGVFWTTALFYEVFGRHDFVCRLPAVLLSSVTPPLLYALGRAIWRPVAGAAAALGFVALPITLSFAHFNALEVPVIAYSTLSLWGAVRYRQAGRRRHLVVAGVGALLAVSSDWPALVWLAAMLGAGAIGLVASRGPMSAERARAARLWVLLAVVSVGSLALYLGLFLSAGKLGDLFASYAMRSSGNEAPLWEVLASRRYWLELSFTPVGIALCVLGAATCLARVVVVRGEGELLPLCLLVMAVFQYVVFRQGADIHVFWPHYFALFIALGLGAIVATLAGLLEARSTLVGGRGASWALGASALVCAVILRDAIPTLHYARATGGRFNEKGLLIDSDGDKTVVLRHLAAKLDASRVVELSPSMKPTWAQIWALGGRVVRTNRPAPGRAAPVHYVADSRFLDDAQAAGLAARFGVTAVGPIWTVDVEAPHRPIAGYRFVEREPTWWEWYFVSATEPVREIAPDPFLEWELRTHFDQGAHAPASAPQTLEERRVAHNIAVVEGGSEEAARAFGELEAAWRPVGVAFEDGTEILGTTFEEGVRPLLTVYVRARGPSTRRVRVGVRSRVVTRASLSTTMPDPTVRDVGIPMAIASELWRPGFVYAAPIPIRGRPGTEVFEVVLRDASGAFLRRDDGPSGRVEVLRY